MKRRASSRRCEQRKPVWGRFIQERVRETEAEKLCVRQRSRREREKRSRGAESMRPREWEGGERDRETGKDQWRDRGQRERQGRRRRLRERRALSQAHGGRETQAPSGSGLRESGILLPTPFTLIRASVSSAASWVGGGGGSRKVGTGGRRRHLGI